MIRTERGWRDIKDLLHLALGLGGWKPKNASVGITCIDRDRQEGSYSGGYLVSLSFLQFYL